MTLSTPTSAIAIPAKSTHPEPVRWAPTAPGVLGQTGAGVSRGWGEVYFSTDYTPTVAGQRAEGAKLRILGRRFPDQVLMVPADPLKLLATTAPRPITRRTIAAANTALWRVEAFNQLVLQQTIFNAWIIHELSERSTPEFRREEIANAAALLSEEVHRTGIGRANAQRGWYRELKDAVEANIKDLDERIRLVPRYLEEPPSSFSMFWWGFSSY